MKISVVQKEPDYLKLKLTPKAWWALLILGLVLSLGSFFIIWALGTVTHVRIDGKKLVVQQLLLNRISLQHLDVPTKNIQRVNTKLYDYSITQSYEVNVVANAKEFPIIFTQLNGDEKKALASRIQTAIQAKREFYYHSELHKMWISFGFGLFLLLSGVANLAVLQTSMVLVSRPGKSIEIEIKGWLLPFILRKQSALLKNITGIDDVECKVGEASSYYVVLKTTEGKDLQLSVGPMFTSDSSKEIKRILSSWLKS